MLCIEGDIYIGSFHITCHRPQYILLVHIALFVAGLNMPKKIEVNVNMHCEKCKTEVLKAVTKLSGINEVSVNLEKQMLVVIGDVDPVCVVKAVRKISKIANITSVGPPKKADDKSKTDPCATFCPPPPPPCYNGFYPAGVVVGHPQPCDAGTCFIL